MAYRKFDVCAALLGCLSLVVFFYQNITMQQSPLSHSTDGGDCQAFKGSRRPQWANPAKMRHAIPEFAALYAKRPIQDRQPVWDALGP